MLLPFRTKGRQGTRQMAPEAMNASGWSGESVKCHTVVQEDKPVYMALDLVRCPRLMRTARGRSSRRYQRHPQEHRRSRPLCSPASAARARYFGSVWSATQKYLQVAWCSLNYLERSMRTTKAREVRPTPPLGPIRAARLAYSEAAARFIDHPQMRCYLEQLWVAAVALHD